MSASGTLFFAFLIDKIYRLIRRKRRRQQEKVPS